MSREKTKAVMKRKMLLLNLENEKKDLIKSILKQNCQSCGKPLIMSLEDFDKFGNFCKTCSGKASKRAEIRGKINELFKELDSI